MSRKNYLKANLKEVIDDNTIRYAGYTFHSNGEIHTKRGKLITVSPATGNVRLSIEKESIVVKGGRIMYELFNDTVLSYSDVIVFSDGDFTNISLDNIEVVNRKDYFHNYEWGYKFSKEEQEKIRREYKENKEKGLTINKLAQKYDCCDITIWRIVNEIYTQAEKNQSKA